MTEAAIDRSTFPLFSNLALELRDQIWRDALPDEVGPALYFYREGCWCPRHLLQTDEEYDSTYELNLKFEFRLELLDVVQIKVPSFFVNREARKIALGWVRKHGIEIRSHKDKTFPIFVSFFNPTRDVLYVALDRWDEFFREPDNRCFQPDLVGQTLDITTANVTRIAVSETLFQKEVAGELAYILAQWYSQLEELFIIVDPQPDMQFADIDMKAQQRWELQSLQSKTFFWNSAPGCFEDRDGKNVDDETLCRLVGEANKELGEELTKNDVRSFEIRRICTVEK
ncbi:hypothetical protein MMC27_005989 [Xylographa pallens]|nr:hypothetical protein [Xylographa pallens]